jgi:hypothetical protein
VSELLRPGVAREAKEKRLATLLSGRTPEALGLLEPLAAAQILGSLELSGFSPSYEEVLAAARGLGGPEPARRLYESLRAARPKEAPSFEGLLSWHRLLGLGEGLRRDVRERDGAPTSPPEFVEGRVRDLLEWLNSEAAAQLKPAQIGALGLARLVEISPFSDGNGRVSRLLASHLMVRKGERPPILVKGDGPRLRDAIERAFMFDTEPLARLLDEAVGRSADVMIQTLAGGGS